MSAASFDDLVASRLDACYRLASVLLGDRVEAEDATQDAIERAYRRWPSLRDPGAAAAWLDRVVVNECRDRLRRRRRTREVVSSISESALSHAIAEDVADADGDRTGGDREALARAVSSLSADHRVAIVLRYFLDLPLDAIAARTGVPEGTVKSRLHYALALLRAAYDAEQRMRDLP